MSPDDRTRNEAEGGPAVHGDVTAWKDPVEAVLLALREAQPEAGMEERLLRQLAATPAETHRTWTPRKLWLAAVPALAMCMLILAVVHRERVADEHGSAQGGLGMQRSATVHPGKTEVGGLASPRVVTTKLQHASANADNFAKGGPLPARVPRRIEAGANVASNPEDTAHQASFPAPPMPLTEQEQLLLHVAHANDPVQLAMLDPRERAEALARDREQVVRFFTPPPLPAELQHEINVALRKQYVNTPPPASLIQ